MKKLRRKEKDNKRKHLINLFKWRSVVAVIACLITVTVSLTAIGYSFISITLEEVREMFRWFTVDSNLLTALAAMLILPFAIEGISKKRLTYPKWVQRIHYSGAICLSMTMVFAVGFISWYDKEIAFGGANLFLHILCPICVITSFMMVESNYTLTRKDNLLALIPLVIYGVIYYYNVMITGAWYDHYNLNAYIPIQISVVLAFILAYLLGWIIRIVYNRLLDHREKKLKLIWQEDLDPVTVKIEIYSLGTHAGLHQEKDDVTIPFDLLEDVSERFDIKLEDLSRAYTKGVIDGMKERNNQS